MKHVYCILLVWCLCVGSLVAQDSGCEGEGTWLPVGEGAATMVLATEMNGELYTLRMDEEQRRAAIEKWNGTELQEIVAAVELWGVHAFVAYQGELYIAGDFDNIAGIPGTRGIAKWNGTMWESVGGGANIDPNPYGYGYIYTMTTYQGKLIVGGILPGVRMGDVAVNGVASWDGTQWEALGAGVTTNSGAEYTCVVRALEANDDLLYVGGYFHNAGGTSANYIAAWDGEDWRTFGNGVSEFVSAIGLYNDEIFVFGEGGIVPGGMFAHSAGHWDGSQWKGVNPSRGVMIRDFTMHEGHLYAGGGFRQLGDAAGTVGVARYNGTQWETVAGLGPGPVRWLQVAGGSLYAGGSFSYSCETELNSIARFCDEQTCGGITGSIFADLDSDCEKDAEEPVIVNRIVHAEPGNYNARVRSDGTFLLWTPPGSYTISINQRNYWETACPTSGTYSVEITEAGQYVNDLDFGLAPTEEAEDLEVSITGSRARPGQPVIYTIRYENIGTLPFTGSIKMTYDPLLTFVESTPEPDRHNGQVLEWEIEDLPIGGMEAIQVVFTLPPDASIAGRTICARVKAKPHSNNNMLHDQSDSEDEYCTQIVNSFDPNMIVVSPGEEPVGYISRKDTVLQYVIHFQNTGNDTAFKIVVVDKLPEQLNVSTLRPGASSHKYELEITKDNELKWTFNNIMLPDSNASEPNSHGYVKYEIQLKKELPAGTTIKNYADIYFDYNEPVRTNEAQSVITWLSPTSVGEATENILSVYPNPANDRVTIMSELLTRGTVTVYNNLGEVMYTTEHTGGDRLELDVRKFAPGVYYISYPTSAGTAGRSLTIVR